RSVTPPWPPPRLMLMSCAYAGAASNSDASNSIGAARRAVVISVFEEKTLRGGPAALTKDSSGGQAARPFRLRGFQTRSWQARLELRPVRDARPAVRGRPAVRRLRRADDEALLRGVAPSRRDFDRPRRPELRP